MKDKVIFLRLLMAITLLLGLTYAFMTEHVPMADGAGWDGVLYREMCRNFMGMWCEGHISAYYLQKCLPFASVNVINTILGISHPLCTLICLHYIAFIMALIAFFKVSDYLNLNRKSEIIVLLLTFCPLIVIKICGYLPYSGDLFAYSFALWIYYFFVSKQHCKMLGVSIIGAFVWQSILPLSLILFALPEKGYNIIDGKLSDMDNLILRVSKVIICLVVVVIPITILINAKLQGGYAMWSDVIPCSFFTLPLWMLLFSTLALLILAYLVVKPIEFSITKILRYIFANMVWGKVLIAVVIYVLFKICLYFLSNPNLDPPLSTEFMIKRILWEPYILPVKFCSTHFAACGLLLPLFILLYKPIMKEISEHSIGYIAAIAMLLVFGLQSETRYVLNFLPFIIFPIGMVLNNKDIKIWAVIAICAFQLFYSGIWYHINTPDLLSALENHWSRDYAHSDIAQRVFFYYGPWQGLKAYAIFMAQFIVFMALLFVGEKRKWFVNNEK